MSSGALIAIGLHSKQRYRSHVTGHDCSQQNSSIDTGTRDQQAANAEESGDFRYEEEKNFSGSLALKEVLLVVMRQVIQALPRIPSAGMLVVTSFEWMQSGLLCAPLHG